MKEDQMKKNEVLEAVKQFLELRENGPVDLETTSRLSHLIDTEPEEDIIECHKYMDEYEKARGITTFQGLI